VMSGSCAVVSGMCYMVSGKCCSGFCKILQRCLGTAAVVSGRMLQWCLGGTSVVSGRCCSSVWEGSAMCIKVSEK
jgi:hypothetical protein